MTIHTMLVSFATGVLFWFCGVWICCFNAKCPRGMEYFYQ